MQVKQLGFKHCETSPAATEYPTCNVMHITRLNIPVMQIKHPGSQATNAPLMLTELIPSLADRQEPC
jgi:hypothetical protein